MTVEAEVKFQLTETEVENLTNFLNSCAIAKPQGKQLLRNTYFDSEDCLFRNQCVTLRIREIEGRYIQTVKGGGSVEGGLHQRDEWEQDIPTAHLDYAILPRELIPAGLTAANFYQRIQPCFTTDFERQLWLWQQEDVVIEIALDQGKVCCNSHHLDICELELELKQGTVAQLRHIAERFRAEFKLNYESASKASRGYELAKLDK